MLEAHVIQTKGFKNVDGGFQVAVRCPYYRGIWASLIEGAELTVDGETYGRDSIRWTLGGQTSRTASPTSPTWARPTSRSSRTRTSRATRRRARHGWTGGTRSSSATGSRRP